MRPSAKLDVAGIPSPFVAEDRHQGQFARGLERGLNGRVVAFQIGIAVEHEERGTEQRQRLPDRPGGPAQLRAVEGVARPPGRTPAVADRLDDLLAEVAQAEDHPAYSLAAELAKLVVR